MGRYALRRVAAFVPVMIGASLLLFVAVFALPGDPTAALGGQRALPAETRELIERRYHLDEPLWQQYVHWLGDVSRGDLGESYASRRPVRDMIGDALPNSLRLASFTLAIEVTIGFAAGIGAALSRRRYVDVLVLVSTTLALAIPVYVLGSSLQYLIGLRWELLPISGTDDGLSSWILPAIVLAVPSLAYVTRLLRAQLLATGHDGYVEMAVAKGLSPRRIVVRHQFRNALPPVVTFLAVDFAAIIGGSLFIESIFNLNGLGQTVARSIGQRDNPVILGCALVFVVAFVVANFVADLVVSALDPRVRDE